MLGPDEPRRSVPVVSLFDTVEFVDVSEVVTKVPIVAVPVDAVMFDPNVIDPNWSGIVAVLIVAVPTESVPIVAVPVEAVMFEPNVIAPS